MTNGRPFTSDLSGQDFWTLLSASFLANLSDGIFWIALPLLSVGLTDSPALVAGDYRPVDVRGPVFTYLRSLDDQAFLIALNLSDLPRSIALPPGIGPGRVEVSTRDHRDRRATGTSIELAADEGLVIRLDRPPDPPGSTML